jgi:tryptophan-rich sensory protein
MTSADSAPVIVSVSGYVLLAGAGAWITDIGPWYRNLRKPSWQPPDFLFGPVWTTIFGLAAYSAILCWRATSTTEQRAWVISAFAINAVGNTVWSYLFFRKRRPDWAFMEVIPFLATIVVMIAVAQTLSVRAAWLLVPYLAWVSFASFLNWTVVMLNRPFGGR